MAPSNWASLGLVAVLALLVSNQISCEVVVWEPDQCSYKLVQSIPDDLLFQWTIGFSMSDTHQVYLDLINKAEKKIQIASFYMSLLCFRSEWENHSSTKPGRQILEALESAARDRKVQVDIIVGRNGPMWTPQEEWERYRSAGINIKVLDPSTLLGDGVQHSKFIVTDDKNFYIGSANWDWRALTQVKEFGIMFENCEPLAGDLAKVFETYEYFSQASAKKGADIPPNLKTKINRSNPVVVRMDGALNEVYLGTSPHDFNGQGNERDLDIDIILDNINRAEKFVYISVMNYSPDQGNRLKRSWPVIDDALRAAFERGVSVRLLISKTKPVFRATDYFTSLNYCKGKDASIQVNYYEVPSYTQFQSSVPHTRLKHDKYMVTDNSVYIGTSNWMASYFSSTCGVGISIRPKAGQDKSDEESIIDKMRVIFERDFFSPYSKNIRMSSSWMLQQNRKI